jgi:hypothetical protein
MPLQIANHYHQVGSILFPTLKYSNQYVTKMVILESISLK